MSTKINDIIAFDQLRTDLRYNIHKSDMRILQSIKKLKIVNLSKVSTDFSKSSEKSNADTISELKQKFLPKMAGKLLTSTIGCKSGLLQRTILSSVAGITVKKILNQRQKDSIH